MTTFDPVQRERELRAESSAWDTSARVPAAPGDIPVVDISGASVSGSDAAARIASEVAHACERVGFFQLTGHGIDRSLVEAIFDEARRFHALPESTKRSIEMDRPDWPLGGVGYLPMHARKLPTRDRGNLNEAFLVKRQEGVDLDANQWLADDVLPGFRSVVEAYAQAMADLAARLLPLYALALDVPSDFFATAFRDPTWRLRMTHYPALTTVTGADDEDHGIAPHVDTTFLTLLAQDAPGLVIYSHERDEWIEAPVDPDAFVVNSGELLKQWTNDRFLSVRHFADNPSDDSRYSIPFFYNATASFPMECVPTCCDAENPPRYPPVSYARSQAAAQGE